MGRPAVERFLSPDGRRILLRFNNTGETWIMRRLPDHEATKYVSELSTWARLPTRSLKGHQPPRPGRGRPLLEIVS